MKRLTTTAIILTLAVTTHGYQNQATGYPAPAPPVSALEPVPAGPGPVMPVQAPAPEPPVLPQLIDNHISHMDTAEAVFSLALPSDDPFGLSRSNLNTLVIPKPDAPAETIAEIAEDMAIMCHILDRKLNKRPDVSAYQFSTGHALSLKLTGSHTHDITEAIYLDGYGAVFMLESAIPLTPPPTIKDAPDEPGDKVWQEMKNELRTDRTYKSAQKSKAKEYDPEKSKELRKLLTESLKHAANIRHINDDDAITLVIRAPQAATQVQEKSVQVKSTGTRSEYSMFLPVEAAVPSTVLTISAKKADIDAFAKGDRNYEQFAEKVRKIDY